MISGGGGIVGGDVLYPEILDPTGREGIADVGSAVHESLLAPRSPDLTGLTVGLLENTKHNAAYLLDRLGEALVRDCGVAELVRGTKHDFGQPLPKDMMESFVNSCDVMVVGVGDCGACSASAVADGIDFERNGIPAAVICSDAYGVTADAMASLRGVPEYNYLTTSHPVAILEHREVDQRAEQLFPQVLARLTDRQAAE